MVHQHGHHYDHLDHFHHDHHHGSNAWLWLGFGFLLVIIVAALIWFFWPRATKSDTEPDPTRKAGFNDPCNSVIQCSEDLTCQAGICKRNIGEPCSKISDCVSQATSCSKGIANTQATTSAEGVCRQGPVGGLNQDPPCEEGLVVGVNGKCKTDVGGTCSQDSDCVSNVCTTDICQPLKDEGEACEPGQCTQGLTCSKGFCQKDGIMTGQQGALCVQDGNIADPLCDPGFVCVQTFDQSFRCVKRTQELGESCSKTSFCILPGICNTNNICSLPTPFSDCSETKTCAEGYQCDRDNDICLAEKNSICVNNDTCVSGAKCESEPFQYKVFELEDSVNWKLSGFTPLPVLTTKVVEAKNQDTNQTFLYALNFQAIWRKFGSPWNSVFTGDQLIDIDVDSKGNLWSIGSEFLVKYTSSFDGSLMVQFFDRFPINNLEGTPRSLSINKSDHFLITTTEGLFIKTFPGATPVKKLSQTGIKSSQWYAVDGTNVNENIEYHTASEIKFFGALEAENLPIPPISKDGISIGQVLLETNDVPLEDFSLMYALNSTQAPNGMMARYKNKIKTSISGYYKDNFLLFKSGKDTMISGARCT